MDKSSNDKERSYDGVLRMRQDWNSKAAQNYLVFKARLEQTQRDILKARAEGRSTSELEQRLDILEHNLDKYRDALFSSEGN